MVEISMRTVGAAILIDQLMDAAAVLDDKTVYVVGTPVHYAPHQEFGTVNHPAQPYMRPAVQIAENQISDAIKRHDDLDAALRFLASVVRDESQRRAPVDTGRLRDSIEMEKRR